jgi:hypothetical protein
MTQTTFKVSPAFVLKAHSVACSEWKGKLEREYPSVFKPAQTFKQGDKVQFTETRSFSGVTYIMANFGDRNMGLVSMKDGNRWANPVTVLNVNSITAEEMESICDTQPLDSILVNGTTPSLKPVASTSKTLEATKEMIFAAYKATPDGKIHKMIKAEFPEAFAPQLFDMYKDGNCTITDINANDVFCGLGAAPTELHGQCLMINQKHGEKPVITEHTNTAGTFWVVTFPKKG